MADGYRETRTGALDARQMRELVDGPAMVKPNHPPVIERLESVAVLVSEVEEFVGILERRLEHVCRPGAPTPAGKDRELERATCSLAMAIRETEQKLVAVGWRLRGLIDTLEV